MMTQSRWRLTHDPGGTPFVLLDFDDWIDDELVPEVLSQFSVTPLAAGAAPFIRDEKNVSYNLNFTAMENFNTEAGARRTIMNRLITIGALTKKPLRVQIAGDAGLITEVYWQFQVAAIRAGVPRRVYRVSGFYVSTKYTILATTLLRVGT